MKRAVGFCNDPECEDYMKGVFLLNHTPPFACPACRKIGFMVPETGESEGKSRYWKEVRVEFNYDPLTRSYRDIAIIKDNSLEGTHNVYRLYSPLVKTEKRALKIAEGLLAALQGHPYFEGEFVPLSRDRVLNFCDPIDKFRRDLNILAKTWEGLRK